MIEVQNLTKHYGRTVAVEGVSFSVENGETLGLLGPNGAGKTTILRIITGYIPPTSGSVTVAGYDVVDDSIEVRRRIGYMPEIPAVYPEMTIRGYLEFIGGVREIPYRSAQLDRVMKICGIDHYSRTHIRKLSKGYRQRVNLAQALLHNPEVIVLDEPTIGLDPKQIIEIRNLIRGLKNNHTVILSSHILAEVTQICNRLVIINQGRMVANGTPEELSMLNKDVQRLSLRVERLSSAIPEILLSIVGIISVADRGEGNFLITYSKELNCRRLISDAVSQHGWGLLELTPIDVSLEDIYLHFTGPEPRSESE
jgi:ABC-2 type transport system ATP-binding protein